MAEKKDGYKLVPMHPFTERQKDVIEALANGASQKEAAHDLNLARSTINIQISGVRDIIQEVTGKRPAKKNWIQLLYGDVLKPTDSKK